MGLVVPGELKDHLKHPVQVDSERTAIRLAEGWLRSVCTGLAEWPSPVPDDLWAWALELAGIAYENPGNMSSRTAGDETTVWSVTRRKEILEAAAEKYGGTSPDYCFPDAEAWPV